MMKPSIINNRNSVFLIFLFTCLGLVLFAPVVGNGFLSDDYDSLYRIYIQKRILYREFLRPMIDISFYFNFLISGLSARSYYLFNISVHIINALLLYRFCSKFILFREKDQQAFAFISSLLFLIYPFHNESIVWLSGRLSSMACLFALMSLIIVHEKSGKRAAFCAGIFYLLGLLCYESIFFLPVIILILVWIKKESIKKLGGPVLFWFTISVLYLIFRLMVSGEITGQYGDRVVDNQIKQKILNSGKVFGRLFFPGSENQRYLVLGTVIMFFVVCLVMGFILKKKIESSTQKTNYLALIAFLLISLLITITFGVSTRTSEGDRLLYFPSCFACMMIASSILWLLHRNELRAIAVSFISIYFIYFLEINNRQWVKASDAAWSVLDKIKNRGQKDIVLINVPDELEGAFVFRNGLVRALLINKTDTSHIKIVSYLKRADYLSADKIISAEPKDSSLVIYPNILISNPQQQTITLTNLQNNFSLNLRKDRNLIYFWNRETLIKLF